MQTDQMLSVRFVLGCVHTQAGNVRIRMGSVTQWVVGMSVTQSSSFITQIHKVPDE